MPLLSPCVFYKNEGTRCPLTHSLCKYTPIFNKKQTFCLFFVVYLMNDTFGLKALLVSRSTIPVITSAASCQRLE